MGRWESSSLVHCTSPMRGTEGVVRVLAVTDGVEMCGEEDGGRYVYREWPRVVRVDPEEGVQARRRWCGGGGRRRATAGGGRACRVQGGRQGADRGAGDDGNECGVQAAGAVTRERDGGGEPQRSGLGRRKRAV